MFGIKNYLSEFDWNIVFDQGSCEDMWSVFCSVIFEIIDKCVPKTQQHATAFKKICYPIRIRKMITTKNALWRRYRTFKTPETKLKYYNSAKLCREAIHDFIKCKENSVIENKNLGGFFKLANKKFSCKSGVGPLRVGVGDSLTNDNSVKVELLNDHFNSVFSVDNHVIPNVERRVPTHVGFNNIVFNPMFTFRAIKKLKINSAGGPDGIKPVFLKNTVRELFHPLTILFETFFHSSYVPNIWRTAQVGVFIFFCNIFQLIQHFSHEFSLFFTLNN